MRWLFDALNSLLFLTFCRSLFLAFIGVGPQQILFTDFSFIFVASYIELPFMILPIFNVLDDLDPNLINASYDLGANRWETFRRVIFPLSLNGVRSGVQSVVIA